MSFILTLRKLGKKYLKILFNPLILRLSWTNDAYFCYFIKKKVFLKYSISIIYKQYRGYKLSTVFNCLFGYNTGVDSGKFMLTLPVNMFVNMIIVPLYTPHMVPLIDIGIA